ncbi:DNA-directed RNA polymerase subunit H [Candidatus Woesearchaeota archaeon]|nr:DNA-directed RNA polymerase subunit H [Candidatus Woesearchaeota archaeon]
MTQVEVKKHALVPKHTKLSEKEKNELFKKYKIEADSLPGISKNDAAISDLNVKLGDVIKIVRNSSTAKTSVFYRVVLNA